MFEGTHTALVTPFRKGEIDEDAFLSLVEEQVAAGVRGVVPVGTTGESPTLSNKEHRRVIELAVEAVAGRALVIAGTGSNSTREAVEMTRFAEKAGADAALLVCPYYNKPSQEGLYQHYRKIAESCGLPLVLYSIPGRCVIQIDVETVARLAEEFSNIVANKEAGGRVERITEQREACPERFELLSGDDALTLPFMEAGAVGVISVAANLVPVEMVELTSKMLAGDVSGARAIHGRLSPLFELLLSLESNPVPIKAALEMVGKMSGKVRLPLVGLDEAKAGVLRDALERLGL